jgi:hypothetical protein
MLSYEAHSAQAETNSFGRIDAILAAIREQAGLERDFESPTELMPGDHESQVQNGGPQPLAGGSALGFRFEVTV